MFILNVDAVFKVKTSKTRSSREGEIVGTSVTSNTTH